MSISKPLLKILRTEDFYLEHTHESLKEGFYVKIYLTDTDYKWFYKTLSGELVKRNGQYRIELDNLVNDLYKS